LVASALFPFFSSASAFFRNSLRAIRTFFPELEGTEDRKWTVAGLNILDERLLVWTFGVDRRSLSLLRG